jgi:hypothetical protein
MATPLAVARAPARLRVWWSSKSAQSGRIIAGVRRSSIAALWHGGVVWQPLSGDIRAHARQTRAASLPARTRARDDFRTCRLARAATTVAGGDPPRISSGVWRAKIAASMTQQDVERRPRRIVFAPSVTRR